MSIGLLRLNSARLDFCEAVALALTMSASDMVSFQAAYHKEGKQGRSKILKAKFSVSNL